MTQGTDIPESKVAQTNRERIRPGPPLPGWQRSNG